MFKKKLTLYVDSKFVSPYAMSAFVALKEKQVSFDLKTIDLSKNEQFSTKYQELSLSARVPTLVHGDFALSESSAISEYLDEVYAHSSYTPLYPEKIIDRAKARQIQAWLRSDFLSIREERTTEVIFNQPIKQPLSSTASKAAEKLVAASLSLLGNKTSLFSQWSIADTDLALMLNRLIFNGDPMPPTLVNYASTQWQRPSVQSWVQQVRASQAEVDSKQLQIGLPK